MFVKVFVSAWVAVWSAQVGYGSEEWRDAMAEGKALHAAGKYSEAIRAFRHAQTLADRSVGDQRRAAEISESLAAAYADAGQITDAEREYRRALAAIEGFEGAQSLDYAVVLATAADLQEGAEVGEDVIARLRDALVKHGRIGTPDNLAIVRIYLSQILYKKRRYGEAEPLLLDALADLEKPSARSPKVKAGVLNALIVLRFDQGRYQEALEVDTEYLHYVEKTLGGNHPAMVVAWANLATNYTKLGRLRDAVSAYETALSLADKARDETNPTYGSLLANYAFALRKVGRKAEAKVLAQRSRQIQNNLDRMNASGATVSVTALQAARK